jgi:hypothetical protein
MILAALWLGSRQSAHSQLNLGFGRTASYFLLRTSSTTCRAAVIIASGASAISWCASTTTCRQPVNNRTRLACN